MLNVSARQYGHSMTAAPIILVPGFWLGAWAWDDVVSALRADGHEVTALTLPGLESADADRSAITLTDHVDAICDAVKSTGSPVVLAVHSGAGVSGYAASDRIPEQIAAMVYVDSGPARGALSPGFDAVESPLPTWQELQEDESGSKAWATSSSRRFGGAPCPNPVARSARLMTSPTTAGSTCRVPCVCSSMTSDEIKAAVEAGYPWIAGLAELRDVTYLDLPTGGWPSGSRPLDLAELLGDVAGEWPRADWPIRRGWRCCSRRRSPLQAPVTPLGAGRRS